MAIFETCLPDALIRTKFGVHDFFLGYVTNEYPVDLEDNKDIGVYAPYLTQAPGLSVKGGSVLRFVDFPPGKSVMHRAVSIDYAIVLDGEMELLLDSGENRHMKRGDVAIQRGTIHQWVNPGNEWARMVFMLQEIEPLVVNGVTLGEHLGELEGTIPPSKM